MDDEPTVDVRVSIPVPIPSGWAWGPLRRFPGVLGCEHVYSEEETIAVARVYARTMSLLIRPHEAERFVIAVIGQVTGLTVCRDQWVWRNGTYQPEGDPLSVYDAAILRYVEITGHLPTKLRT